MERLSNNKRSIFASLGQLKFRRKYGLFRVEGKKSIKDCIGKFELDALLLTEEFLIANTVYSEYSDKIFICKKSDINSISGLTTPTEVIAIFRIPDNTERLKEILSGPLPDDRLFLLLDGVQDPGNMGTIIRTAHWFGINDIFISEECVDIYNPKTVQSTMGSLPFINVFRLNLEKVIELNPSFPVYGLLLDGNNIYFADLGKHGFIIMGNEGNGISCTLRKKITSPLTIPPYNPGNHSESLNVATATAVTLALFRKDN